MSQAHIVGDDGHVEESDKLLGNLKNHDDQKQQADKDRTKEIQENSNEGIPGRSNFEGHHMVTEILIASLLIVLLKCCGLKN